MLIVPKHKPNQDELLDWMATIPGFIEGTMSIDNSPVILDDWQRTVITDDSKFVAGIKARQIGWSAIACAAKALVRSNLISRNLSVFISMNLDDAQEKLVHPLRFIPQRQQRSRVPLCNHPAGQRFLDLHRQVEQPQ